jgi:hypothetical protein
VGDGSAIDPHTVLVLGHDGGALPGRQLAGSDHLSVRLVASITPEQIGRMLSGDEMSRLMLRLVDSRKP